MSNVADVRAGCANRLVDGAYRAITCWMPCDASNATVKRALYNDLKGTAEACALGDLTVIREPDVGLVDLYPQLELPKGICEFGWSCRHSAKSWNAFARLLWAPVESALKRLAATFE